MTTFEIYKRLLEELHWHNQDRSTGSTRVCLQDVLIGLRNNAAVEEGMSEQEIQDQGESFATRKNFYGSIS